MLQRRDLVPHFTVKTISGEEFRYQSIWQRENLVLVTLGRTPGDVAYAGEVSTRAAEFVERDSACVITHDSVPGVPMPGALIADRWGEIVHVTDGLPPASELLEWLDYVGQRCPECEGEAR